MRPVSAAERIGGLAQVLCGKLGMIASFGTGEERCECGAGTLDLLAMAGAGDKWGFSAAVIVARKRDQRRSESFQSLAGLGGNGDGAVVRLPRWDKIDFVEHRD